MKKKNIYIVISLFILVILVGVFGGNFKNLIKSNPEISFVKPSDNSSVSDKFDLVVKTNLSEADFNLIFKRLNGMIVDERVMVDRYNNEDGNCLLKDKISLPDDSKPGDSFLLMVEAFEKGMKQSPENLIFRKQIKLSYKG